VKDLICTKGIRTASGSYAYADLVPDEDDVVVERIKAAGAIVIGKTQVPEFGYSGTGQSLRSRPVTRGTPSAPPAARRPAPVPR
jgi:aspartyl-tRNA(Asn)/glutamyl-tRNA(Gln) amidotransferase subunit A